MAEMGTTLPPSALRQARKDDHQTACRDRGGASPRIVERQNRASEHPDPADHSPRVRLPLTPGRHRARDALTRRPLPTPTRPVTPPPVPTGGSSFQAGSYWWRSCRGGIRFPVLDSRSPSPLKGSRPGSMGWRHLPWSPSSWWPLVLLAVIGSADYAFARLPYASPAMLCQSMEFRSRHGPRMRRAGPQPRVEWRNVATTRDNLNNFLSSPAEYWTTYAG
jgi:hypothetical protein